jgi:hypothetical protein
MGRKGLLEEIDSRVENTSTMRLLKFRCGRSSPDDLISQKTIGYLNVADKKIMGIVVRAVPDQVNKMAMIFFGIVLGIQKQK